MLKALIWTNSKNKLDTFTYRNVNHSIFVSNFKDTKFKDIKKTMKQNDCSYAVKIADDNKITVFYKRNSVWTLINFERILISYLRANGKEVRSVRTYKKACESEGIDFFGNKFFDDLISFVLDENFFNIFKSQETDEVTISDVLTFSSSKEQWDKFIKRIESKTQQGIEVIDLLKLKENEYLIKTRQGEIIIKYSEGEVICTYLSISSPNREYVVKKYNESTMLNIKFNILEEKKIVNENKKMSTKDLILIILGIATLFILFYATFNFVFTPEQSSTSLEILKSDFTWRHHWIYLLLINFVIGLFYGPIIFWIVVKLFAQNKKIEKGRLINLFVGGQLRMIAVFITGNAIIATIIWAWYMKSVVKIRTVSLIGVMSSLNILKGIIMIPIGSIFMIRGTIFNYHTLFLMGQSSEFIAYTTLSWIGWVWNIVHNLSLSLLIILPPLHILWSWIIELRHGRKDDVSTLLNRMTNFELNLITLKNSTKAMLKDKVKMARVTTVILVGIILELFEFTYSLRIVEDFWANETLNTANQFQTARYNNLLAISSVRYMSNFAYHVPIINALPGQGMGLTDEILKNSTEGIILNAHGGYSNISESEVKNLSAQTTFIIRFFNFYLRKIVAFMVSLIFVIKGISLKVKVGVKNG